MWFLSVKYITNMYGLSSGQWPSYLRLVVAVEWGYEEVQQVLGVLMPNRHDEQWSPWSGDGKAHVPCILLFVVSAVSIHLCTLWWLLSGGVGLWKKSAMRDCCCMPWAMSGSNIQRLKGLGFTKSIWVPARRSNSVSNDLHGLVMV